MALSILVVEDDKDLQEYLREILVEHRYMVHLASTGTSARDLFFEVNPNLVLLDLGLPDISGESLRQEFKDASPTTPIIILTAEDSPKILAHNLQAGADDFISKPFTTDELMARISSRLRKSISDDKILKTGDIVLNIESLEVEVNGKAISLTKTELELLRYLLENKNKILTREMILSRVWSLNPDIETRVVDVYIGYLRKKIEKHTDKTVIHSKRGYGYSIKDSSK